MKHINAHGRADAVRPWLFRFRPQATQEQAMSEPERGASPALVTDGPGGVSPPKA